MDRANVSRINSVGVGASFQEKPHDIDVIFSHRQVQGRAVFVISALNVSPLIQQPVNLTHIAGFGRGKQLLFPCLGRRRCRHIGLIPKSLRSVAHANGAKTCGSCNTPANDGTKKRNHTMIDHTVEASYACDGSPPAWTQTVGTEETGANVSVSISPFKSKQSYALTRCVLPCRTDSQEHTLPRRWSHADRAVACA